MEQEIDSAFENFNKKIIRRSLLPIWIKIFCWIFMFFGLCALSCLIYGLFNNHVNLAFYGFETEKPISLIGIFIITIMIFKGFVAYSLWFEKENAINLAKIDTIVGITICVISMFVMPFIHEGSVFQIRLELLFLILFYRKIDNIEYEWANLEEQ